MPATAVAPQHMKALEHANRVRLARAELKRRVAGGELSVADVVRSSPIAADGMTIGDLLMCQRRWGQQRCRRLLTAVQMPETKTIGSMTERQRVTLVDRLASGAASARLAEPALAG